MKTLIFIDDNGEKIEITRECGDTFEDMANFYYTLSLAMTFSEAVINGNLRCEYNDWGWFDEDE